MKNVAIFIFFGFSTLAASQAISADSRETPAEKFHKEILNKNKSSQSIAPELVGNENPHVKPFASIIQSSRWNTLSIPVCWENPSPEYEQSMAWTREAAEQTWQKFSSLKFVGWQKCANSNLGIRIQINDTGPHVKTIGQYLNKMKNGMVLNFTFNNWSQSCKNNLEDCIKSISVHEFGHAIGFTHEQNHPKAPGECKKLAQGSNPDTLLTPYDPSSSMNYCNKKWNNDGFLSPMDVEAVQILYGKPQS